MKSYAAGLLAGVGAIALASPVIAQDLPRFDLGAGWSYITPDDVDLNAVVVRGSFHLNDHIGAEAEGQFGIDDDNVGLIKVELDNAFGIYGRGDIQVMDTLGLFGRVGYVDMEFDTSLPGFTLSDSSDGWAAGLGGEFFFFGPAGGSGLRADYTYYDFDDGNADGFSLSYIYRFGR